ncbi:tail fiber assembly protein [Roseobacter phage CRP-118]|uniref:Tail fiber assembly protein n=1 Tax=Roseobacter phage CRP-118 TaxID=3072843 RepID=A0AAX4G2L6_9CAUD|nr:tail fiber assembly protein [Roseobacter phage CRP-118]
MVDLSQYTQAQIDHDNDLLSAYQRNKRDELLKETDWWAVTDRTMSQQQLDYRQSLRDVPSQSGFPSSIIWPVKP